MLGSDHYIARILDSLSADPSRVCLVWRDQPVSARELIEEVHSAARGLRALGVDESAVVGILTETNSPATLVLRYAANLLGATALHLAGVNAVDPGDRLPAARQREMLTGSNVTVLATDPASAALARSLVDASGPRIAVLGAAGHSDPEPVAAQHGDVAVVTYTSGSTGHPKGIAWSFAVKGELAANAARAGLRSTFLVTAPLTHSSSFVVDNALVSGGSVVLHPGFDPAEVLRAIAAYRITRLMLAAPQVYALAEHGAAHTADLSSVKSLMYTGTAAAPERLAHAVRVLGPVLEQVYGSSECGQICRLGTADHLRPALLQTAGRPVDGVEVRVHDPDGGGTGEVWVRSPWAMAGYWGDPGLTARTIRDGWVRTGDLGHLDEHGYLRLHGRLADVIKTNGIKVYPEAVEVALLEHPAVARAAVFGVAGADRVERTHAAVVLRPNGHATAAALRRHVAERLSPNHAPAVVELRADLPMVGIGKPDRRRLRARAAPTITPAVLVRRQGERHPDRTALVCGDDEVGYAELDARAVRLARLLIEKDVAAEHIVALALPRSVDLVVAILAVGKAGAAYLPIDPDYPAERIAFMLADARPSLLCTTSEAAARLPVGGPPRIVLDALGELESPADPRPVSPAHAAYVIYTSGSTGHPKGVVVTNAGLAALAESKVERMAVDAGSRMLQFASPSFDAFLTELLATVHAGATLVIPPPDTGPLAGDTLTKVLIDKAISHAVLPVTAADSVPVDEPHDVRTLVLAGERCPRDLVARWAPGRRVINAYGPTEATVCATMSEPLAGDGRGDPTIGAPIPGVSAHVLDPSLRPVPAGLTGELYLGGPGLARGYLNRPGLTAQRFVANPFGEPGARMYRTGDLASWRDDGTLSFHGRVDDQIKLRGFRIELGEVEAVLRRAPEIARAAAAVREQRLVAYVVPAFGAHPTPAQLRGHMTRLVPEHLVPSAFVVLDELVLTPNGKVDRNALPWPPPTAADTSSGIAPRDWREAALAEIYAEVLGVAEVGIDGDFFALGGDSMLAIAVIRKAREAGLAISPRQVIGNPTVAALAAAAESLGEAA